MKRLNLFSTVTVVVLLGAAPAAFAENLKPIDPNGPYANASGTATMHWEKVWATCGGMWEPPYRCYHYEGWAQYHFDGLAPKTDYFLGGMCKDGTYVWLGAFGTDDDGAAVGNGSICSGKFSILYYELWSDSDPTIYQVGEPDQLLLSSQ